MPSEAKDQPVPPLRPHEQVDSGSPADFPSSEAPPVNRDPGASSAPDPSAAARDALVAGKTFAETVGVLACIAIERVAQAIRATCKRLISSGGDAARRVAHYIQGVPDRVKAGDWRALLPRRTASPMEGGAPSPTGRGWSWRRVAGTAFAAVLALVATYVLYSLWTLPIDSGLQAEAGQSAMTFEADSGENFANRGVFKGVKLAAADLPPHLAQAIIAIEDRRFYTHGGIDLRGVMRAAWRNAQAGGTREGGSTITQQLARLMFLSQERAMRRKVQEALLALWLESQLSKEEILLRYLNTAYFGAGAYGVDAAAKRYFGKSAKDLSLGESAMLAGLVRAPSQLAPTRNFGGARERAELVLQAMAEIGAITPQQAQAAHAESVVLRTPPETPPGANYFVDMVAGEVRRLLGSAPVDVTLRTTLNLELQRLAEGVVERRLEVEGDKKNATQAALVAMRHDGAIVALVGGRDYEESQFNRAIQARRQAGSLFKLFVYLAAFQKGHDPQSVLVDRPVQIGEWEPQNASGRFRGAVNLRTAFAQSINTVAAQLADEVGIPVIVDTAKRMGVQSNLPAVPSLALGAAEVTLLEMTRAYAAVPAGVDAIEPYAIQTISGGSAQTLYRRAGPQVKGQLGESRAMMLQLLQAVVAEGTGRAARLPGITAGGKTGTSQDYRDAWFVGYTPDLVVGVWVGNDGVDGP